MHIHSNVSSHRIFLVWKRNCRTMSSRNILCANAELRDLKPKLLCGSGSAERQVAVYFLCGSGTTGLPSVIPCAESECQTLISHNILCAEVLSTVETELKIQNCT